MQYHSRSSTRLLKVLAVLALGVASAGAGANAALAGTITVAPAADARVERSNPDANYGASPLLSADGDPVVESVLRFSVSGSSGAVSAAKLRLFVTNGSGDGPALYASDANWSETGVTWNTRPARTSPAVGDLGSVAAGSWLEYDVTSVVKGDGVYSFTLASPYWDSTGADSRETGRKPELVVTTSEPVSPPSSPPPVVVSPPPTTSCTKTQASSESAQSLINRLSSGDVGCLRGGTHSGSVSVSSKSNVTITEVPGEQAMICGSFQVKSSSKDVTVSDLAIDGSCSSQITVHIYANDVKFLRNDVTNQHRAQSCVIVGSKTYGIAYDALLDGNRIHGCGYLTSSPELHHGIYAQSPRNARFVNNVIYDVAGFGIQFYSDSDGSVFEHNIVDGARTKSGLLFGGSSNYASEGNTVRWNIFTFNKQYGTDSWWGGSVGTGNLGESNCFWGNGSGTQGGSRGYAKGSSFSADPLYMDRANGDFRRKDGSPCADMGPQTASMRVVATTSMATTSAATTSAATMTSVTLRGAVSRLKPLRQYARSVGGGVVSARLTHRGAGSLSLAILDRRGTVVARAAGTRPLRIQKRLRAGTYRFAVRTRGATAAFALALTHPLR